MRFNLYKDIGAFHRDTCELLLRHEAQNLIPLGNIILGNEGRDKTEWRDPAAWFMGTVSDDSAGTAAGINADGIRLTAIMTPPYNLTLYATDNRVDEEAIACLIDGLGSTPFIVPGVMSETSLARNFASAYARSRKLNFSVTMNQRIYELTEVNPDIPVAGNLRLARESDMSFLPYWIEGFSADCFGKPGLVSPCPESYLHKISQNALYILEDSGTPVSMSMIVREMKAVCGVSEVYTPPYFRKKGYASSCVAGVSKLILERGYRSCALYTDLANPVSNSIYQKIGYKPICDSVQIEFK